MNKNNVNRFNEDTQDAPKSQTKSIITRQTILSVGKSGVANGHLSQKKNQNGQSSTNNLRLSKAVNNIKQIDKNEADNLIDRISINVDKKP